MALNDFKNIENINKYSVYIYQQVLDTRRLSAICVVSCLTEIGLDIP